MSARAGSGARIAVVGGGVAGLATAALLARDGHDVELLERGDGLGGRAGSWARDGFRFDTGPSWYLMPEVFDRFFELMGTNTGSVLNLVPLDPGYRVFFEGEAEPVDIAADLEQNVATFERMEVGGGESLRRHVASAQHAYDMTLKHFLYTSFTAPRDLAKPEILASIHKLVPLLAQSLGRQVAGRFRDERLRKILGYPAVFLGTSPDRAPSMYHLMSALDLTGGVAYPQGGFAGLVDVLVELARSAGVRIRTGCEVTAITTTAVGELRPDRRPSAGMGRSVGARRARVTGVRFRTASGSEELLTADVVIGALDLHHLQTQLLPEHLRDRSRDWWGRVDPGPGAVLVLLGIEGRIEQLEHHSLFFTRDWDANFGDIRAGRVPNPASAYVCAPSRTDPDVAPGGMENLFILVPVPADPDLGAGGPDGTGAPAVEQIADDAITMIADMAGIPDLRERIRVRRTIGPADFEADFHALRGGMLGPAHTLRQSAFLRSPNASRKVAGLFYSGASTIPGIGLPMCVISAELARDRANAFLEARIR